MGRFCSGDALLSRAGDILTLNRAGAEAYKRAYAFLQAACRIPVPEDPDAVSEGTAQANAYLASLPCINAFPGRLHKRFYSAFTYRGIEDRTNTVRSRCSLCVRLDGGERGTAFLKRVQDGALSLGYDCTVGFDPIMPLKPQILLLPDADTVFFASPVDPLLSPEACFVKQGLLDLAKTNLVEAKTYHDALEAIYIPAVDFSALDRFTDALIESMLNR